MEIHEIFHSAGKTRQILVADDEMINREILGEILKDEYEVIFACDGKETLEMIRRYKDTLSLVLLDILMPGMSGLEVLRTIKADHLLSHIPVIVTTAERDTEVESLRLGAADFIPKPYPAVDVIHARVLRTIELSEDRDIIQSTEKDALTGLLNKEYFYKYALQMDLHNHEMEMDVVMVDVNHFHMINERYGRAYGDDVLRRIGKQLQKLCADSGAIACRQDADMFVIYTPHREDYEDIADNELNFGADEETSDDRIHIRMGVYSQADKTIEMDRRIDRAKMAADTVKGSYTKTVAYFDNDLHKKQIYEEQLIEEFPAAIRENQFRVFYQPKFDVRPDMPVLYSAEALVRWIHPTLGMISPGIFIPLFEEYGLIQQLDRYVWKETASQIHEWKERLKYSVPVSVNVSRIDLYDPELPDILNSITEEAGITNHDLLLEITETAYAQDSAQIVKTVEKLRGLGFRIEMDDFGSGYSSLNMISTMPIDALKLDMQLIRNSLKEGGSTHILEVIIGISEYLSVPVIAEGVETQDQLHTLKSIGCDIVQGYFFSKPVGAEEFEPFILQKKEADIAGKSGAVEDNKEDMSDLDESIRNAKLEIIHNQTDNAAQPDIKIPVNETGRTGIQLRTATLFFAVISLIAAAALLFADISVSNGYSRMEKASDRYIEAQLAASDMVNGSDYLTDRVRCFVVTGEISYLKDFVEEIEVTRRRDKAVETMETLLGNDEWGTVESLNTALDLSNELVNYENKAMRLVLEAGRYDLSEVPAEILDIELTEEEKAMTPEEMIRTAQTIVFDNNYMHYKERIRENVNICTQTLIRSSSQELEHASTRLSVLVNIQTIMTIVFLLVVLGIVIIITRLIRKPLTNLVQKMQEQEMVTPAGVEELRIVTRVYNEILEENHKARERLSHEASHDALTGLFNRGAYDLLMESADTEHMALLIIDVDHFKTINDTYGHAVGDRVLKRVAEILRSSFRSVDILCRIGGDEFAVVMTRANSSMSQLVLNKMDRVNDMLQHPRDDLPPVSISVGVAFSDRENPQGDIFRDADSALYQVKATGKNGCAIFDGNNSSSEKNYDKGNR